MTGDQLSREFYAVCGPESHKRVLLWDIFEDVCSSFDLAMTNAGVPDAQRAEVRATVSDYLANHYGV